MTPHVPQPAGTDLVLRRLDLDGITTLTLNRPRQYNALSEELLNALQANLDDLSTDPSVRVIVLTGAGKAFCAGHDLKEMRSTPEKGYYQALFAACSQMMLSIARLPQPVIAKVNGLATAAGCQLVAACDLAVASSEARFATSGVNLGLFCATPGVPLSRNVGRKQALEMLLTGDFISAEKAVRIGLLNTSVPPEQLDGEVSKLAIGLAAKPAIALRLGKELFYRQLEEHVDKAYADAGDVMACNMMTPEATEGIDAFIEKRAPVWPRAVS